MKKSLMLALVCLVGIATTLCFTGCGCNSNPPHTHSFAIEWTTDGINHWHACSGCDEIKDNDAHTFEWVIDTPATYKAEGSKHEHCSVCGYNKTAVEIEKLAKENPTYTTPTNLTATYGETLQEVVLPEGFTFESSLTTSVGNVGNNIFTVKYVVLNDEEERYNEITGISVTITVSKATGLVSNIESLTRPYNGLAVENPTYDKVGDGAVTFEWYKGTTKLDSAPINVGTYIVKVLIAETTNCTSAFAEQSFAIEKSYDALDNASILDKSYDGIAVDETDITGILGDGTLSCVWKKDGMGTSNTIDVGNYSVEISYINATNYANNYKTLYFKINKGATSITTSPTQTSTNYVGQKLSSVVLTGGEGSVAGTFAFANINGIIDATSKSYDVVFTPTSSNYATSTVSVIVVATQFKINATAGEGGKIQINSIDATGDFNVNYNYNYTVAFVPTSGTTNYTVSTITIDGVALTGTDLDSAISNGYNFNSLTANHTVAVTFIIAESHYDLTLNITTPAGGTVKLDNVATTGFDATSTTYGSHSISWTINENYYLKSLTIRGVKILENITYSSNQNFNLTADTVITVEFALVEKTVKIFTYNGNYNFPSKDKITYGDELGDGNTVYTIKVPYGTNKDITFTLVEGYIITKVEIAGISIDADTLATVNSTKKLTVQNVTANLTEVNFIVSPVTTKMTIIKTTKDDNASSKFSSVNFPAEGYTGLYGAQRSDYIFIPQGCGLHIYKDGDKTTDLLSFCMPNYDETKNLTVNFKLPFDKVDCQYEFEFYTRYLDITLDITGEGCFALSKNADGTLNTITSPYKVIKYSQYNYIHIVPSTGFSIASFKVDGVDTVYEKGNRDNIDGAYYLLNHPTSNMTLSVSFEVSKFKATVTGYAPEYFEKFDLYSIVPGGTEALKAKDSDGNYTFTYGEKVSKYDFIFAEDYKWSGSQILVNGNAQKLIFGNATEAQVFATPIAIARDFTINITAKLANFFVNIYITNAQSVSIEVAGEPAVVNKNEEDYYFLGTNTTDTCIPIHSSVKITIVPLVGYGFPSGLQKEGSKICDVNADGNIVYEYTATESKYLRVEGYAKKIELDLTIKLDNGDNTFTDISVENWGTYIKTDESKYLNYFSYSNNGKLLFTYGSTIEKQVEVKSGYTITSFVFNGVEQTEAVRLGGTMNHKVETLTLTGEIIIKASPSI